MDTTALKPNFGNEPAIRQDNLVMFISALGKDLETIWPGLALSTFSSAHPHEKPFMVIEIVDPQKPTSSKDIAWFIKFYHFISFKKFVTVQSTEDSPDGFQEITVKTKYVDKNWTPAETLNDFKEAFLRYLYMCAPDENGNYTDDPKNNRKLPIITRYFATTFPNMEGAPWRGDRHSSSIPRARGGFELPGVETQTYKP